MANIESFHDIPHADHEGRATAWAMMLAGCVCFWASVIFFAVRYF